MDLRRSQDDAALTNFVDQYFMESNIIDFFVSLKDNPTSINALSALLAAVVTFFGAQLAGKIQTAQSEKDKNDQLREIRKTNEDLTKQNDGLKNALDYIKDRSDKIQLSNEELTRSNVENFKVLEDYAMRERESSSNIVTLQAQLINEQKKAALAQQELMNYQTGGDSYCYFTFLVNNHENNAVLYLHHSGLYPLRNLKIIFSEDELEPFGDSSEHMYDAIVKKSGKKQIFFSILGPKSSSPIGTIPLLKKPGKKNWHVTFESDGGQKVWHQRVVFKSYNLSVSPKEFSHNYHEYEFQVYEIKDTLINEEVSDFSGKQRVIQTTAWIQNIFRECSNDNIKTDWSTIPHGSYNSNGSIRTGHFFQTKYLDGAKDCK